MSLVFSSRVRIRKKVLVCSFLNTVSCDISILNPRLYVRMAALPGIYFLSYYFITVLFFQWVKLIYAGGLWPGHVTPWGFQPFWSPPRGWVLKCVELVSWNPSCPPFPHLAEAGLQKTLGTLCHQSDRLPGPAEQGCRLLCPVFSAKERVTVFFVNSFFFFSDKKKKVKCALRENERCTVANSLTKKSWALSLCPTQKQPGTRCPD